MKPSPFIWLVGGVVIGLLLGGLVWYTRRAPVMDAQIISPQPVACTMEAKVCPDGSYVGRVGPRCEFAACPTTPSQPAVPTPAPLPSAPVTSTPPGTSVLPPLRPGEHRVSFVYAPVKTEYVGVQWPPSVRVSDETYSCQEVDSASTGMARTTKKIINGRSYCVTTQSEGAAGTVYTEYTYVSPLDQKTVTIQFTVSQVRCENYDDPQRALCQDTQSAFNPDALAQMMIGSVRVE